MRENKFAIFLGVFSLGWVILSMNVIIPGFRGSEHFGSDYYSYIGENPLLIFKAFFRSETFSYLHELMSPLWYLSLLSPLHLAIALPEFGIVLLSTNSNMRNTYFHYDTVLTAFIFLSAIYGVKNQVWISKRFKANSLPAIFVIALILIPACIASYNSGPIAWKKGIYMIDQTMPMMTEHVHYWREFLSDDTIKVSSTGHLAPHFTSRRYFYDFSWKYEKADYVLIDVRDAQSGFLRHQTVSAYATLQSDKRYVKIYNKDGLEVYKRIKN